MSTVRSVFSAAETFVLALTPHGGQRTARSNALAAVLADSNAAAARRRYWGELIGPYPSPGESSPASRAARPAEAEPA